MLGHMKYIGFLLSIYKLQFGTTFIMSDVLLPLKPVEVDWTIFVMCRSCIISWSVLCAGGYNRIQIWRLVDGLVDWYI